MSDRRDGLSSSKINCVADMSVTCSSPITVSEYLSHERSLNNTIMRLILWSEQVSDVISLP